jgi:hypothetical protein
MVWLVHARVPQLNRHTHTHLTRTHSHTHARTHTHTHTRSCNSKRGEYEPLLMESGDRGRRRDSVNQALLDKYSHVTAEKEIAAMNCRYYLRSSPQYSLHKQLGDVGSRVNKAWFCVSCVGRDDQMMMMLPRSQKCCFPLTKTVKKTLKGMFLLLQHPYVFPITDIDFVDERDIIVVMTPLNVKGSLKDTIHQVGPITHTHPCISTHARTHTHAR